MGGITLSTHVNLTIDNQSLPPILYIENFTSMPSCSKAPRGLFVLVWVGRIFTAISISPGSLSRQCSSHYAFRAGRLLSAEVFRYLRTVIVTAAIDQDLSRKLLSDKSGITPSLDLLALGRRQHLYIHLRVCRHLWFC
jgi:hypothetical protein